MTMVAALLEDIFTPMKRFHQRYIRATVFQSLKTTYAAPAPPSRSIGAVQRALTMVRGTFLLQSATSNQFIF